MGLGDENVTGPRFYCVIYEQIFENGRGFCYTVANRMNSRIVCRMGWMYRGEIEVA